MPESTTTQGEQQQRLEVKLRRELGDTILILLNDDAVKDIVLNPDGALWAKQMGSGFRRVGQMSASQAVCAMNTIASMRSMVLNYERPVLETELPIDGSRFEGLIPPVVRHPVFAIRRRPRRIFTLDQYCEAGILTERADPLNRLRRRENFADQLAGLRMPMSYVAEQQARLAPTGIRADSATPTRPVATGPAIGSIPVGDGGAPQLAALARALTGGNPTSGGTTPAAGVSAASEYDGQNLQAQKEACLDKARMGSIADDYLSRSNRSWPDEVTQ